MKKDILKDIVSLALLEDIGGGDITTNILVPANHVSRARLLFKSTGVLCGLDLAKACFKKIQPNLQFKSTFKDGDHLKPGTIIADITGKTRAILTAERVALNFLTFLSSIATNTSLFVKAVKPYQSLVMDTRKTTPLLRLLDRYAVRTGGGVNHRFNLNSMAMIKDNHYRISKNPAVLVSSIRRQSRKGIILEVDSLDQLRVGLMASPEVILLDNMSIPDTKKAVSMRNEINKKVLLESSGGITLRTIKSYAACGVDRISIGGLTQQRLAVDIALDIES